MKQTNGSVIFSGDDQRITRIGWIEIEPGDSSREIFTAILTQDKLARSQTVLHIPIPTSFTNQANEFQKLASLRKKVQAQLILFTTPESPLTRFAKKEKILVFSDQEAYRAYAEKTIPEQLPPVQADDTQMSLAFPILSGQKNLAQPENHPNIDQPTSPLPPTSSIAVAPVFPRKGKKQSQSRPASRGRWLLIIGLLLVFSLLASAIGSIFLGLGPLPALFPAQKAIIHLTPEALNRTEIYAVQANPNPNRNPDTQIEARYLYINLTREQQNAQATGTGKLPGLSSTGTLTFFNSSTKEQHLPAGVIITTEQGIFLTNDNAVTIPAAETEETPGSLDVAAHALEAGKAGNIEANTLKQLPCCQSGITVSNLTAFENGQDTQNFSYIQQIDIDAVVSELQQKANIEASQKLQSEIQIGEKGVKDTPDCHSLSSSSHPAGSLEKAFTVVLTLSCTQEVYNSQQAEAIASRLFQQAQDPGSEYSRSGSTKTTILSLKKDNQQGFLTLEVQASELWVRKIDQAHQQNIAQALVGKTPQEATTYLHQQPEIRGVEIELTGFPAGILPLDASQILMIIT